MRRRARSLNFYFAYDNDFIYFCFSYAREKIVVADDWCSIYIEGRPHQVSNWPVVGCTIPRFSSHPELEGAIETDGTYFRTLHVLPQDQGETS